MKLDFTWSCFPSHTLQAPLHKHLPSWLPGGLATRGKVRSGRAVTFPPGGQGSECAEVMETKGDPHTPAGHESNSFLPVQTLTVPPALSAQPLLTSMMCQMPLFCQAEALLVCSISKAPRSPGENCPIAGTWDAGWTLRAGHLGDSSPGITASLHLIANWIELFSCKKIL